MYRCEKTGPQRLNTKGCFQTTVVEKTLESPLNFKEIRPVNPKGNQSLIFTRRTEAEALVFWPPNAKNQKDHLLKKRPCYWERLRHRKGGNGG